MTDQTAPAIRETSDGFRAGFVTFHADGSSTIFVLGIFDTERDALDAWPRDQR